MENKRGVKIAVWIVLVVFACFYCGNTLFSHTHILDGHLIVHSHPYLPAGSHTHSSVAFQCISAMNMAGSVMVASAVMCGCSPDIVVEYQLLSVCGRNPLMICLNTYGLRDPPAQMAG